MKKTSGMARQCAVAVALALLSGAATIAAAYGDDGEDTTAVVIPLPLPSGETPPDQQTPPSPSDEPVPEPVPEPEPIPEPVPEPIPEPAPAPAPNPAQPSVPETPVPGNALPNVSDGTRLERPLLAPPNLDGAAAVNGEAVPAMNEATPTPAPSITSEASAATVATALPEPVSKTIDAVVATTSGSPLYIQILTVLALIGAGIAYFRVLGSKGTRVPSKSVK